MSTEEFSNEFDTLLNSYSSINEFGKQGLLELDEYEKSIFLTQAQEDVVLETYNGRNTLGEAFEETEETRRALSSLVKTFTTKIKEKSNSGISDNSQFFTLPDDLWFITYEAVNLKNDSKEYKHIIVIPVTQDDYNRVKNNPFKRDTNRRVLRLDSSNNIVELISKYNIEQYTVRYLSKPEPIILSDLADGTSINGKNERTECKLNPVLHRAILDRAVRLAISTKSINTGK